MVTTAENMQHFSRYNFCRM